MDRLYNESNSFTVKTRDLELSSASCYLGYFGSLYLSFLMCKMVIVIAPTSKGFVRLSQWKDSKYLEKFLANIKYAINKRYSVAILERENKYNDKPAIFEI